MAATFEEYRKKCIESVYRDIESKIITKRETESKITGLVIGLTFLSEDWERTEELQKELFEINKTLRSEIV